jgi:hypothetical protein
VSRPKRGTSISALVALPFATAALLPAAARATITVGSDLSTPPTDSSDNCILSTPPCTHLLVGVHPGNAFPKVSPTSGTIVSFGLRTGVPSGANETDTFRLGRLDNNCCSGNGTGDGTGPTITVHEPGIYSFPASLPVKAGDYVGIDTPSTRAFADYPSNCAPTGAGYFTYHPVLTNGGPFQPADANSICELLVNMVIQPSNTFSFSKLKGNYKRGIVILTIEVPGPGELSVAGKGVKRASASGRARESKTVTAAGATKLKIKAAGKAKARLNATGKVAVQALITFSPVGGQASTVKLKVKLRKRV